MSAPELPIENIKSFVEFEMTVGPSRYKYILDTVVYEAISYQNERNDGFSEKTISVLKKIEEMIESEIERPLEGKRVRAKRLLKEILTLCE